MLTTLILLSQVGLPMHFHYCKGMLESVSLLFNPGCDDHQEVSDLPACCAKSTADNHCSKEKDNCCDDEVLVLSQDIQSLTPHFLKWLDVPFLHTVTASPVQLTQQPIGTDIYDQFIADNGPPLYLLHKAFIFYA